MSVDDDLYEPIQHWRVKCERIKNWIRNRYHEDLSKFIYPLDRARPAGALTLLEFAEHHYERGRTWFWRCDMNKDLKVKEFQFSGTIIEASGTHALSYPAYFEIGGNIPRSIEDANLVPNTYTRSYIFLTEAEAKAAVDWLEIS